jgi:hypothetical protein
MKNGGQKLGELGGMRVRSWEREGFGKISRGNVEGNVVKGKGCGKRGYGAKTMITVVGSENYHRLNYRNVLNGWVEMERSVSGEVGGIGWRYRGGSINGCDRWRGRG